MDTLGEYFKMRLFIGAIVLFIVAAAYSYAEANYLAFGVTTDAKFTKVEQVKQRKRYGGSTIRSYAHYVFSELEGGAARKESDAVDDDWVAPETGVVRIQYVPGWPGWSRLDGHVQWWSLVLCGGAGLFMMGAGYTFWRGYVAHERALERSRSR